jgi:hypothetical protein
VRWLRTAALGPHDSVGPRSGMSRYQPMRNGGRIRGRDRISCLSVTPSTRQCSNTPQAHRARGPLAQLAEQQTLNLRVEGSIPSRLTTITIQRDQQLAVGCCGDRRQESNRPRRRSGLTDESARWRGSNKTDNQEPLNRRLRRVPRQRRCLSRRQRRRGPDIDRPREQLFEGPTHRVATQLARASASRTASWASRP